MKGLALGIALLGLAALAMFEIGRLVFEFAQEDPEYGVWEPLVGILAWATGIGILIGVARLSQTVHRVALAAILPVGVVIATALLISGLGVVLLVFADMKHKLIGVVEPFAVVAALIFASAVLAGATMYARRGAGSQGQEW